MTAEEKAKAYDEALERAKIWQEHLYEVDDKDYADELNYIFPELKESEDEKVRKHIIEVIKNHFSGEDADKCIAWLEKLKVFTEHGDGLYYFGNNGFTYVGSPIWDNDSWPEKQGQSKKTTIWKHWKDGIAGNGEGNPVFLIKNGLHYSISSCLGYECDYIELSELDRLLEKQGEQKPAWSEEDEVRLQACIDILQAKSIMGKVDTIQTNWLKSLKNRIKGE